MGEVRLRNVANTVTAVFLSAAAAALTVIVVVVASMPVGLAAFKLGLITDEGAAWFGISVGIPLGLVCAVVVFVYCFLRITRKGQPVSIP